MAEVYSLGRVAIDTTVTTQTIRGKDTVRCGGAMVLSIKEIGIKASRQDLATYRCQMVL